MIGVGYHLHHLFYSFRYTSDEDGLSKRPRRKSFRQSRKGATPRVKRASIVRRAPAGDSGDDEGSPGHDVPDGSSRVRKSFHYKAYIIEQGSLSSIYIQPDSADLCTRVFYCRLVHPCVLLLGVFN